MEQLYMCVSTGRKNGEVYSMMARIVHGQKDNGDTYAFIDNKSTIRETEEIKLGTILAYQTTRGAPAK